MSIPKRIVIGSDHAGYDLRLNIKTYLEQLGIQVQDEGTFSKERTDYPLYAEKVARAVLAGEAEKGILVCGTGVGMSITANKFSGIRAVVCSEPLSAELSQQHNDTNILALGAYVIAPGLARMIVKTWLNAEFEGGRHAGRLKLIQELELQQADKLLSQKGEPK